MPSSGYPFTTDRRAAERQDVCAPLAVRENEGLAAYAAGTLRARQCAWHRQAIGKVLTEEDMRELGSLVAPAQLQQTQSGCVQGVESGSYALLGAKDAVQRKRLWQASGQEAVAEAFAFLLAP